MRAVAVVALLALAACSAGEDESAPAAESETSACAEVRAGIDAFNRGAFDETQRHFRLAVPLALDEHAAEPSRRTADLLEAVQYYAELAPGEYAASSQSSPEFARYKAITLGQCEPPVGDPDPEPDRVTV